MKLAKLVSVFLREDKHKHFSQKQGQNFIVDVPCYWAHAVHHILCKVKLFTFCCVVRQLVTEHVMLKEIFDKQDSIF